MAKLFYDYFLISLRIRKLNEWHTLRSIKNQYVNSQLEMSYLKRAAALRANLIELRAGGLKSGSNYFTNY